MVVECILPEAIVIRVGGLCQGRMTLMFSATFPKEIQKLAQAFMRPGLLGCRIRSHIGSRVQGLGGKIESF